jgi:hypothetical protein
MNKQVANGLLIGIEIGGIKTRVGIGLVELVPAKLKEDVFVIGALCLE